MRTNLSPKELALVIGVSESSLKRWVDEGRVEAARTAGGHRRISIQESVRFIREHHHPVVRPDLLGVADLTQDAVESVKAGEGEAVLLQALTQGQGELARGIIVAHYLACRSVATVCDGAIAHSMHRMGELWRHREDGIGLEHQATSICIEAIHLIRTLLPPLPETGICAVGGAIESDPYILPSLMAATCMRENGVRDVNLGPDTPVESLIEAAERNKAKLVWVSASARGSGVSLPEAIQTLAKGVERLGASLLIGGRALCGVPLPASPCVHAVESMSELVAFVRSSLAKERSGFAGRGAATALQR